MNYKELPDDTRIWIYQANRQLSDIEIEKIQQLGNTFIDEWTAHGAKLKAALEMFHNQFVIIFADEKQAKASGCSIDKSVYFIKEIEHELAITLIDRNLITYMQGNDVNTCTREKFAELILKNEVTDSTIVFNNLITTKRELKSNWQIPLSKSWHRDLVS